MSIKSLTDFIDSGSIEKFDQPGSNYRFEAEGQLVNHPRLLPSHIYTFVSLNPRGNDSVSSLDDYQSGVAKGVKPYFDNRPIFISLGKEGPMEIGLNLKLIQTSTRESFIRLYLKLLRPVLEKLVDQSGNFIELESRIRLQELTPLLKVNRDFIKQVSSLSDVNLEFLVDKYRREDMRFLRLIDWPHVPKLSQVNYSQDPMIATRTPISYYLTKFN